MKHLKKSAACAMSVLLAASCLTLPVNAQAAAKSKDESVFIALAADGSIREQTVSDWLHCDAGLSTLRDESSLENITNLKGEDVPTREGKYLVWNTDAKDVYYQGTSKATPPVTAAITYTLDGKQMRAEDAIGRSGHLKITIALTNNARCQRTVDGKSRTVFTPFITAVGTVLPTEGYSNIQAAHGTVQTDGNHNLVGFVCMPGMQKNFDGLLTGKFSELQSKFLDEVTLEADVTSFEAPSILIACASDAALLAADTDFSKFTDVLGDLNTLSNATDRLVEGAKALANGSGTLASGTDTLANGTDALANGTDSLASGTDTLASGASSLLSGAAELKTGTAKAQEGANTLNTGLATLAGKNAELNAGAKQIADGVLATANSELKKALGDSAPVLTWENYAQVLGALSGVTDDMRSAAKAQIAAQSGLQDAQLSALLVLSAGQLVGAQPDAAACLAAVQAAGSWMAAASQYSTATGALQAAGGQPIAVPAVTAVLDALLTQQGLPISDATRAAAYAQVASQITQPLDDAAKAVLVTMACTQIAANASLALPDALTACGAALQLAAAHAAEVQSAMAEAAAPTPEGTEKVQGFLTQLVLAANGDKLQAVSGLLGTLNSINSFVNGLSAYTAGVASASTGAQTLLGGTQALAGGAGKLYDGIAQLQNGSSSLQSGAKQVQNGAKQVQSGAKQVQSGAKQLQSGANELANGITTYQNDGIRKITDAPELKSLQGLLDVTDAMREQAKDYVSYTGAPAGVTASVKFVMKTQAVEPSAEALAAQQAAAPAQEQEQTTFFSRILNLFRTKG